MIDERVPGARRRLLALVATGLTAALAWTAFGSFSTASGQSPSPAATVERAHRGARRPTFDKPIFFLILGGDARTGNPATARADSIHIAGIDPTTRRASIVGIPRDSFVEIPGHGTNKINAASQYGIDTVIRTMENLSTCRFDYYMMTSFEGFRGPRGHYRDQGIINEIGGVHVQVRETLTERLPYPVARGNNLLNGGEALSFARNRHERPRGDIDRSLAQGTLMAATQAEMRRDFAANPGTVLRNIAVLRKWVRMDISLSESLNLGLVGLSIRPRDVDNIVVDSVIGSDPRAGSIVNITARGRAQLVDVCGDALLNR